MTDGGVDRRRATGSMVKANVQEVRPATQAGKFYPAEREFLGKVVDRFLSGASVAEERAAPKAVIAPHSGYIYSGAVAGNAFAPWRSLGQRIERVVVLGPSHYFDFPGVALPDARFFSSPLGEMEIDQASVDLLLEHNFVRIFEAAHLQEHSIEAELPFLQRLFPAAAIVPLIVGRADAVQMSSLVNLLWGGEETVLVISSDLSHHRAYGTAKKMDQQTARLIEKMDYLKLTADQACGYRSIRGFLRAALKREMRCVVADLRNSGDTAGVDLEVVGFGAFSFYEL